MQALRIGLRSARAVAARESSRATHVRGLSTASSSEQPRPVPWFVDPSELQKAGPSHHPTPTVLTPANLRPLPSDLPSTHPIAHLHAQLLTSPHLEHEYTIVRDPVPTDIGPPLAEAAPRGKRKRGKTNGGEGFGDIGMSPWRWIVVAQVKEGSENRGAIESVARIVRKSVRCMNPWTTEPAFITCIRS